MLKHLHTITGKDSHIEHTIALVWPLVNITKSHAAKGHSMLDAEIETVYHNYVVRYTIAKLYCDMSQ